MTRLEEFGKMIEAIEAAESWDAYPEYWEKLCYWYEIDVRDTEKYTQPEDVFSAIVEAYKAEGGTKMSEKLYIIRDREAGTEMDEYETLEEAIDCVKRFEAEDKENGNYTKDFYEIIERIGDDHKTVWPWEED